jgi:chemotaxis protein methyltransferase CheR
LIAASPSTADLDRFRGLIERHLGLRFDQNNGTQQLTKALRIRLQANHQACEPYLEQLKNGPSTELAALGTELTVGETYFLRHVEQFQALAERAVPERLGIPGRTGELRVLSAGCSSGEETYSLAIVLREAGLAASATILGVDVNPAALAKAREALYTTWSLRSVPDSIRRRWFTAEGDDVRLDPSIRSQVRFERHNLAVEDPVLWQPESFDVVFCRNVLMYFAPDVMAAAVGRIARSLAPGGFLFLGSAETLRGISPDFELCESHGTFYYRRKPVILDDGFRAVVSRPVDLHTAPDLGVLPDLGGAPDLRMVLELLGMERFAEALIALDDVTPAASEDPQLLLLRAALLTHTGDYPAAAAGCRRLLERRELRGDRGGDLRAEAHLLLATGSEFEADLPAAIGHYRTAISCDPRFAMAHMQLGRLALRTGDRLTAGREYAASTRLLPDEADRRILLFGGGFDRESLISLGRTLCAATTITIGAGAEPVGAQR